MVKIVVIGGGTGTFTVLRGLKKYPVSLSAVVSTFDSGGSTGKLRDELGILPPGDIRRCFIALADEGSENILRDLMTVRFTGCADGHSFGNLLLAAAERVYGKGVGIQKLHALLRLQGTVCPVSIDDAHLCAELEDGKIIMGETHIDIPRGERAAIKRVFLQPDAKAHELALHAIQEADLIVIGPGDLYTSVIPNLLVDGVPDALRKAQAKLVYVCNMMTKNGETDGYTVTKFVSEIEHYIGRKVDNILCHENGLDQEKLIRYAEKKQFPVVPDMNSDSRIVCTKLASETDLIRHDPQKLAKELMKIVHNL